MRKFYRWFCSLRPRWVLLSLFLPVFVAAAEQGSTDDNDNAELRAWIGAMKTETRGPFARIRWFCNDGTVLPPKSYGCREHGGGRQHGEWSERTRQIRADGFAIANVFSEVATAEVLSSDDYLLQQMLLEQFLINVDDGWILRQARYYRGAFQTEGEQDAARRILKALLLDQEWLEHRLLLTYETARLLPHGKGPPN